MEPCTDAWCVADLMERAKQAAPQGQTSPQGASDASATTASGALPMDAPSLTSALKETRKDTGASAPRTGTVQASQAEAASPTGSKAAAAPATHGGDVLPVQPVAAQPGGNGSAASAHIGVHQNVPSSARSATSAAAAAAAAQKVDSAGQQHSSTSAMREGLQSQSQQRASPSWQSHQAQSGLRDGLMSRPSSTRSQDQSRWVHIGC